jgi:hypothetical protein
VPQRRLIDVDEFDGGDAAALRLLPLPWRRSGKRKREKVRVEVRGDGNGRGGVR